MLFIYLFLSRFKEKAHPGPRVDSRSHISDDSDYPDLGIVWL